MVAFDYAKVGGKERPEWEPTFTALYGDAATINAGPIIDFGWIPPEARTQEQHDIDADIRADVLLPKFAIEGKSTDVDKAWLFDLWEHPTTIQSLGFKFPGTHQLTGSCVGAAGGNVHGTLSMVEAIRLGDPEEIIVPFWLLTYGRSRFHGGMKGQGEGSFGSAYAKAALQDGIIPGNLPELPKFTHTDGLVWGAATEMTWSAGDRKPCTDWLEKSRKHLVKSAAPARNSNDVRAGIINGYPSTCASMYGHTPKIVGSGSDAILMGIKGPRWGHQMSVLAFWVHPKHGLIFWLMNQWGLKVHGIDPAGGPPGGVWITAADLDWICSTGEVFIFSQFDGFPAATFVWNN